MRWPSSVRFFLQYPHIPMFVTAPVLEAPPVVVEQVQPAPSVEYETPAPLSCPPSCNNRCRWSNQCRDSCCFEVAVHRQIVPGGPTELRGWSRSVCLPTESASLIFGTGSIFRAPPVVSIPCQSPLIQRSSADDRRSSADDRRSSADDQRSSADGLWSSACGWPQGSPSRLAVVVRWVRSGSIVAGRVSTAWSATFHLVGR